MWCALDKMSQGHENCEAISCTLICNRCAGGLLEELCLHNKEDKPAKRTKMNIVANTYIAKCDKLYNGIFPER